MNLKKLTQAVFEGLPKEYRWAAYDITGDCYAYKIKPKQDYGVSQWDVVDRANNAKLVGEWCLDLDEETGHWLHSMIERQDVPTAADIDWSRQDAPEGATHYRPEGKLFFYKNDRGLRYWSEAHERWIESNEPDSLTSRISELVEIRKPAPQIESITDVARSIEAARVAEQFKVEPCPYGCVAATIEQACMPWPDGDPRHFETSDVPETKKYPHYFKDVSGVDAIDLYHVARLYDITDPALFHAFKKIACAGKRGAKDRAQDVQEAIDALKRWQELNA